MSRMDQVVFLIASDNSGTNVIGDPIATDPSRRETLAEKLSIRQSEFYQAAVAGHRPEITFVLWASEYNDERLIEHEGIVYTIMRTYQKTAKKVELTCTGLINGG